VDLRELLLLVALLLVVALALAIFHRGADLMEVAPEHDTFFKGVLDGTLVIGARLLEHLVKRVGPSRRLPRVPVLGSSDEIRISGVALCLRLLFGLLLRATLGGRLGGVFLRLPLRLLVYPEDGFDCLLTRGELGGDIHQFARLGGSLAPQFAHQVSASGAGEESSDDVRVDDVRQLDALLQKLPDVLSEGFPWLLAAALEIPCVPRAHVRALEISRESLNQVVPVRDLRRRQMLEPGPGGVGEKKGKIADDEVVVIYPSQLACQPVIREPQLRPRLPQVLGDGSRGSEPGGERRSSYGPAEDSWTG
jgi:hypothetical protein